LQYKDSPINGPIQHTQKHVALFWHASDSLSTYVCEQSTGHQTAASALWFVSLTVAFEK